MRLSQGATSNVSLIALGLSLVAALFGAYMLWLEPDRVQALTELANAKRLENEVNREVMVQMTRMADFFEANDRRRVENERLNRENAELRRRMAK